jgi:hypothetical protein
MNKIQAVLANYDDKGGPGAALPEGDVLILREYLILKLEASGVPIDEAAKIVAAFHWGSWSEGWETGYASAKSFYGERFSLGSRS